jgi:hypothetical protein
VVVRRSTLPSYVLCSDRLRASVLLFFAALLLFSFQRMTKAIRIVMGAAAGFIAVLVIWCIINSWDSGDEDDEELVDFKDGQDASG